MKEEVGTASVNYGFQFSLDQKPKLEWKCKQPLCEQKKNQQTSRVSKLGFVVQSDEMPMPFCGMTEQYFQNLPEILPLCGLISPTLFLKTRIFMARRYTHMSLPRARFE